MSGRVMVINGADNVAVALEDMKEGDVIEIPGAGTLHLLEDIPYSHKIALVPVRAGGPVLKYGETIGRASRDIRRGEWVHTHNIESEKSE